MNVKQQLKKDEGLMLKPYRCSMGKLTIGYGYNLENGIPQEIADMLFDISYNRAHKSAIRIMVDNNIPPYQELHNILLQMCFQLGEMGTRAFKKMIAAIQRGDYKQAAAEMLNSAWHKQTPERCERLANEMSQLF